MKNIVYGVAFRLPIGDKLGVTADKTRIIKRYASHPLVAEFYLLTFETEKEAQLCIRQTRSLNRGEIIHDEELVRPLSVETYC